MYEVNISLVAVCVAHKATGPPQSDWGNSSSLAETSHLFVCFLTFGLGTGPIESAPQFSEIWPSRFVRSSHMDLMLIPKHGF